MINGNKIKTNFSSSSFIILIKKSITGLEKVILEDILKYDDDKGSSEAILLNEEIINYKKKKKDLSDFSLVDYVDSGKFEFTIESLQEEIKKGSDVYGKQVTYLGQAYVLEFLDVFQNYGIIEFHKTEI